MIQALIGQLKDMNQFLSELVTAWDRDSASADGENEVEVGAEEVGEEERMGKLKKMKNNFPRRERRRRLEGADSGGEKENVMFLGSKIIRTIDIHKQFFSSKRLSICDLIMHDGF